MPALPPVVRRNRSTLRNYEDHGASPFVYKALAAAIFLKHPSIDESSATKPSYSIERQLAESKELASVKNQQIVISVRTEAAAAAAAAALLRENDDK